MLNFNLQAYVPSNMKTYFLQSTKQRESKSWKEYSSLAHTSARPCSEHRKCWDSHYMSAVLQSHLERKQRQKKSSSDYENVRLQRDAVT